MPREKIPDPDTKGLHLQVSWRRHDEETGNTAPGHVQVSTVNERADAEVNSLLGEASRIMAMLTSIAVCGELPGPEVDETVGAWRARWDNFRTELTGTYVSLRPDTMQAALKALHKSSYQAWTAEERRIAVEHARAQPTLAADDLDPH